MKITNDQIAQALRQAAAKLAPRGAWTQGHLARDSHGAPVRATSTDAVQWCLAGALNSLRLPTGLTNAALDELRNYITAKSPGAHSSIHPTFWNDREGQTKRTVLRTMRACADQLSPLLPPNG